MKLLWAFEITFIKFLWPLLFLANNRSSWEVSSSSNITFNDEPEIGVIPCASHLLKNLTIANIFDLSVRASDGTECFIAHSTS